MEDGPRSAAQSSSSASPELEPGPTAPADWTPPELDHDARARMASLRAELFGVISEPQRVDRFIVLEGLGAGGMGEVLAAYDPRLNRRVALKLVKPEVAATPARSEARLLREAQAMARLSHPNVVQIHEVGLWSGRVFIAMELVVGRSLAAWLEARPRGWREIVRVFVEAGRGLAAAHAVGIVHRDFKPANVLVGDDGRVRVTDFGLALALHSPADATTSRDEGDPLGALVGPSVTAPGARAGTPGYMSPEQFLGRTATAASDQFSFCVALYHALHGVRPFAGDDREALARAVLAGAIEAPPRLRVPRRVHRALLRGLSRAPEDRFPAMTALLAAIDVRPPWRAVALAAAFFAAGLGASSLALRADPCDGDALLAGAWDPATRAAAEQAFTRSRLPDAAVLWASASRRLDEYAASVSSAYTQSCRAQRRGESSRELHDLRVACLRRRLAVVRGVSGALLGGEPDALRNATLAAGRLDDLGGCEDERALLLGMDPPPPALLGELTRLGERLDEARSLELIGDMKASAARTDEALATARRLGHAPTLAAALFQRGRLDVHAHAYAAADEALRTALELAIGQRQDALVGELWSWWITADVQRRGEASGADAGLRQAEAWLRRGDGSPGLLASLERARGIVLQIANDNVGAEVASRRALELRERLLGPDHLEVAIDRYNLANSLDLLGRFDDAIEAFHRALAVMRANVGDEHPLTADVHYNLGVALVRLGRPESIAQGEEELLRGRAILRAVRGPHAPELAAPALALARVAYERGDLDRAEAWLDESLAIHARHPGRPDHALALALRGALAYGGDRLDVALAAHAEARALALRHWGPMSDVVGAADSNIADILQLRGDLRGALRRYMSALVVLERAFGAEAGELIPPLLGRGEVLIAMGHPCAAIAGVERALKLLEQREAAAAELDEARRLRGKAAARCDARR